MSHYNKYKDVEIKLPDIRCKLDGEYRMEAFRGFEFPRGSGIVWEYPGTHRLVLDWFPNIVTNIGLENYGQGVNGMDFCHVGTDTTPELATDTGLIAFVAGVVQTQRTSSAQSSPPYWGSHTAKYRFSPNFGGGNVNLNEVGASSTVTTGNLSSRSLTVDSMGDPVTVSVLVDEYLDVFYKRRNYPAHIVEATGAPSDLTGSIDVSGTNYGYTVRPHIVTTGGSIAGGSGAGWGSGLHKKFSFENGYAFNTSSAARAHDETAALGAVTSFLTGTNVDETFTPVLGTYVASSYQREISYSWGVDAANFGTGIGGLTIKTTLGAYQVLFDTPITKVQGELFTYFHNFSWDRHTTFIP